MLSLRRSCFGLLSCVDFVKAIQIKRPEFQMAEVVIYVSSALLPRVRHLCNVVSLMRNIILSINAHIKEASLQQRTLHRGQQDGHNGEDFV